MARKFIDAASASREMILSRGRNVVQIEADALQLLGQALDDNFVEACQLILRCSQRIVVTGIGKSGHIARKIAATFSATGTPALFLHPAEAAHGDLGMLTQGDTLIVISNSGNTSELQPVLYHAKALGLSIIGMASQRSSLVMEQADIRLTYPAIREACFANIAPTTSTTLQLALGDALAIAVMEMRGIASDGLRLLHPGGAIGLRLTPVRNIMHGPDNLPIVSVDASMPDAILTMTSAGFGIVGVMDHRGDLVGVITDGDLRRHFSELSTASAAQIMTRAPKTILADMIAEEALVLLNDSKITAAFVIERRQNQHPDRPVGIVHIHDFVRLGLR